MSTLSNKPIYLIRPDDSLIAALKPTFEAVLQQDTHTVNIDVPPEALELGHVHIPQEFILALQHFPHYIEQLLFSMTFKFPQVADSELYFQEMDWKTDPKYYRWFNKMGEFPLTFFFVNDSDVRFYVLAGDLLADGKLPVDKVDPNRKRARVAVEKEQVEILCQRLFNSCYMLHMYCHGSGFNPKTYIEAVLAEYSLPIHYEQIHKQYIKDVKNKVTLWVKPQ